MKDPSRINVFRLLAPVVRVLFLGPAGPLFTAETAGARAKPTAETRLDHMRALSKARQWKQLVSEFKGTDLASWPSAGEAFRLRGQAFARLKDAAALRDMKRAVQHAPDHGYTWYALADVCKGLLGHEQEALDAYVKAYELDAAAHTRTSYGWMPISATLNAAMILRDRGEYDRALALLNRYTPEDLAHMGSYYRRRMLRAYAGIYAGQGKEREALDKFREANRLEEAEQDQFRSKRFRERRESGS